MSHLHDPRAAFLKTNIIYEPHNRRLQQTPYDTMLLCRGHRAVSLGLSVSCLCMAQCRFNVLDYTTINNWVNNWVNVSCLLGGGGVVYSSGHKLEQKKYYDQFKCSHIIILCHIVLTPIRLILKPKVGGLH